MLVLIWASLFLNYKVAESLSENNTTPTSNVSTGPSYNVSSTTNERNPEAYFVSSNTNESSPEADFVSSNTNQSIAEADCVNSTTEVHERLKCLLNQLFLIVKQPQVIIAFLTGILLTATICCLVGACHRIKRKSENLAENMEMVTTETVRMVDDCQAVECDDGTHGQAAEAAGTSAPDGDQELKEVEYSNIVFFGSRSSLTQDRDAQETTETEYAEIKKDTAEERQDDGGEGGEVLEDNREYEEEKMLEEELETGLSVLAGEEGEDGAVYSTVTREHEEAGGRTEIHVQI